MSRVGPSDRSSVTTRRTLHALADGKDAQLHSANGVDRFQTGNYRPPPADTPPPMAGGIVLSTNLRSVQNPRRGVLDTPIRCHRRRRGTRAAPCDDLTPPRFTFPRIPATPPHRGHRHPCEYSFMSSDHLLPRLRSCKPFHSFDVGSTVDSPTSAGLGMPIFGHHVPRCPPGGSFVGNNAPRLVVALDMQSPTAAAVGCRRRHDRLVVRNRRTPRRSIRPRT